jgi:chorismate-pyruvate lyase
MLTHAQLLAQAERPGHLHDVDLAGLPPELRVILFHDGTLTTALEAYRLGPVAVDVRDQENVLLDETHARLLDAPIGTEAIRRLVDIRDGMTAELVASAHSLLIVDRLPDIFLDTLITCRNGLGEALGQLQLESRRELLWLGRSADGTVTRGYRVISQGSPVLFIEESFPHWNGS